MRTGNTVDKNSRLYFVITSATFSIAVLYVYLEVFAAPGFFDYMGVRATAPSVAIMTLFLCFSVLPAFWIPVHVDRPTDIVQIFLFYSVHVPTCVLIALVSQSPIETQISYVLAQTAGISAPQLRYLVPNLAIRRVALKPAVFWAFVAVLYCACLAIFINSGYVSVSNLSFLDVYDQRLELSDRAGEIGSLFFYAANWCGAALAPFLIVVGLSSRRVLPVVAGLAIALVSFVASSNKANYMAVPIVIGCFLLMRHTQGRNLAVLMGMAWISLVAALLAVDIGLLGGPTDVPAITTWTVFHRTFTNNGFLSAIYLDLFSDIGFAHYSDSFLRWISANPFGLPVAQLAGRSFTAVPDVHANAHLWADGFANWGYAGMAFSAVSLTVVLWLFDNLSRHLSRTVVATALIVPASVLSNASVHTALLSNGLVLVLLLLWLWQGKVIMQND